MITHLSFLSNMIMNAYLLENITAVVIATKQFNLYKYSGFVAYSSVSTLIGLCLTFLPLILAKSNQNKIVSDVIYVDREVWGGGRLLN